MDGFMESSWYALRYCSPQTTEWLDQEEVDYWMPVDQYIGGVEHATKHLIYARFFTKMLRDWGWIPKRISTSRSRACSTQGMVVKETYRCVEHDYLYPEEVKDGACVHCGKPVTVGRIEKMSKSLKNVVEPLPLIEKYGADTVRIFSLFAAPPDSMLEWSDAGVEGAWRFLNRVYRAGREVRGKPASPRERRPSSAEDARDHQEGHRGRRERFSSTRRSRRSWSWSTRSTRRDPSRVDREAVETVVRLLAPMAPHLCEELWRRLGHGEARCW